MKSHPTVLQPDNNRRITFILQIPADFKNISEIAPWISYVKGSKIDELVILDAEGKISEQLEKNKEFNELVENLRAKYQRGTFDFSVFDESKSTHIINIADPTKLVAGDLNLFLQKNRPKISSSAITSLQSQEEKMPFFKKLMMPFMSFILNILSPLWSKDISTMLLIVPIFIAKKLGQSLFEKHASQLYNARLSGFKVIYNQSFTTTKLTDRPLLLENFLLPFTRRWEWFIKQPLNELKGRIDWNNGSHSIYRLIFVLLIFVAGIGMPLLSFDYGVTWDEKIQYEYGSDILKYYQTGGKDTSIFDYSKSMYQPMSYYGCSFDIVTAQVNQWLGDADDYEVRHVINALFGLFMMIYVGLIARLLGSWRTACLAFLFAVLSPSLFGHSMNNPKDIPFAATYIFAVYYIIKILRNLPNPKSGDIFWLIIAIGWTVSTRVGGLILVAFLGLFMAIHWLTNLRKVGFSLGFKLIKNYALTLIIVAVGGYFTGLAIWPYGQKAPLKNPIEALNSLSKVNYLHTYENFDGKRIYMSDVPWYYILKHISIGSPLFIIIGFLVTFLLAKWISKKYNFSFILLLSFIFFFPIAYVAYKKSVVYNGWRHFLFVYLSLVIIAAIGWDYLIGHLNKKYLKICALIILLGLTGKVSAWMVMNHPDQYIYFNELVGGTKGANGNYEMDYYSNTINRAVKWLIKNEKLEHKNVKVLTNNELMTLSHYSKQMADSVQILWTRDYERQKKDYDYAIFTSRTYSPTQIKNGYFPPKGTIKTIDVDGVPVCAIVKRENSYMYDGYALTTLNKYEEAVPYFQKAIAYHPIDEEAHRMLGLCYLNLGKPKEALVSIDKSIELFPEGFMSYYMKGFYYLGMSDPDKAEIMFKTCVKNRINNGDAHAELGNIYLNRGMATMAIESYQNAIGFEHSNPQTFTNMASAYMINQNYEVAIKLLDMALGKNPNLLEAYEKMAECFEKLGDMQTAIKIKQRIQQMKGG